jgi:hypothetical protein
MPQKNDLSAIKAVNKKTLLQTETTTKIEVKENNKAGRKPKPAKEKESETVVLKLTQQELENLKEKAGLVPLGTFIKHHLRNKTDLLN